MHINQVSRIDGMAELMSPVYQISYLLTVPIEFILFLRFNVRDSSHFLVNILGTLLHLTDTVKNLAMWFDADFSFSEHIQKTCIACFLQMRDLGRIR